ncbi:ABC transporter permease [Clostridium perfringens]|uniref:ABC transporter permease n=3 Tax=Clostridium perfringens TaxID=1502 RepID=A0AAP6WT62_CLOPF|nr:ABC transporter permease [Clostridium perfringens]EDT23814.1 putative membrane protein [Clostridium perfringens B str. ATCC 3626]NGU31811.1 ABC transporter permease [Clostridium perfringens]WEV05983.1 ABC transporter permease [Clostridium perfringens B]VTQ55031.1 membrane-spanning protein [Clostridium perfringens]HAT4340949.1 ABC transporter permease [Clostridium perfringens]
MKNYIKSEFKRALFSKKTLIYLIITILAFVIALLDYSNFSLKNLKDLKLEGSFDCIDLFLISRSSTNASILPMISPLLACLIFSTSYLDEKNSKFLNLIYSRLNKKTYIFTKLFVNAISSGLVILVAYLIVFFFMALYFGLNLKYNNLTPITGPFSYFYYNNKWIYFIIILVVSFLFNVIFATLGLGISTIINNKYLAFLAPFFYYILTGTLFISLGLYDLNATYLFNLKYGYTIINLLTYQLVLLIIGTVVFYVGVLYNNEKNL